MNKPANERWIIQTDGLTKRFRQTVAVDGLNLSVHHGEIFGLVGPDGAGKTTTIRMLCAVMDPSSGQAWVAGLDTVADAEQIKRRIGYMAQRFNLYGDLSAEENLDFFADIFQVPVRVRQERKERLLRFARLTDFRRRRAAHLSGGMQKKLALACTLIHQPEIIFLDEPTTGVDPVSRREFWDILTELHMQGITIFVSTPYMDEAERCSRVGLIYQGRIIVCDTPEQIKSLVTGELLEIRPSNLRQAEKVVQSLDGVLEVQTYGDLLHAFVDSAQTREAAIRGSLAEAGISVVGVRSIRPRMEEAFISLVRRQSAG
ncbi:MAG: ABC transporter ATP-binding protein [Anaerolineae bacterium]|nr:ABC transporter ATP-binding protein [Anaerolineae bacterium]